MENVLRKYQIIFFVIFILFAKSFALPSFFDLTPDRSPNFVPSVSKNANLDLEKGDQELHFDKGFRKGPPTTPPPTIISFPTPPPRTTMTTTRRIIISATSITPPIFPFITERPPPPPPTVPCWHDPSHHYGHPPPNYGSHYGGQRPRGIGDFELTRAVQFNNTANSTGDFVFNKTLRDAGEGHSGGHSGSGKSRRGLENEFNDYDLLNSNNENETTKAAASLSPLFRALNHSAIINKTTKVFDALKDMVMRSGNQFLTLNATHSNATGNETKTNSPREEVEADPSETIPIADEIKNWVFRSAPAENQTTNNGTEDNVVHKNWAGNETKNETEPERKISPKFKFFWN